MAKVTIASIQNITVELGGQDVPLDIQVNKRARNISVRVDERTGGVGLVLPRFVSKAEGLAFVREKTHWILRQLRDLPPRVQQGSSRAPRHASADGRASTAPGGVVRRVVRRVLRPLQVVRHRDGHE